MSEPQPPTYEAFCQDIRDTRGNPGLMLRLIADLKRLVKEGAFSGHMEAERQGPGAAT